MEKHVEQKEEQSSKLAENSGSSVPVKRDEVKGDDDEEEELTPAEMTTAVTLENCTKAALLTVVTALLGEWLHIDYSSFYRADFGVSK